MIYPVLSIRQPYAALIVLGFKDIENRDKACPVKLIGQTVLIHAAKKMHENYAETEGEKQVRDRVEGLAVLDAGDARVKEICRSSFSRNVLPYRRGCIIGSARVVVCTKPSPMREALREHSMWGEEDAVHIHLESARPLEIFDCPGMPGWFEVDYPHALKE